MMRIQRTKTGWVWPVDGINVPIRVFVDVPPPTEDTIDFDEAVVTLDLRKKSIAEQKRIRGTAAVPTSSEEVE